jgi:hypothetical protein
LSDLPMPPPENPALPALKETFFILLETSILETGRKAILLGAEMQK